MFGGCFKIGGLQGLVGVGVLHVAADAADGEFCFGGGAAGAGRATAGASGMGPGSHFAFGGGEGNKGTGLRGLGRATAWEALA